MTLRRGSEILVARLEIADRLWPRTIGLIGRAGLPEGQALWIQRCNSVHTFFMRFAIDLVFVDRDLVVKKTVKQVPPNRLVWPVWGATSVIELNAGYLDRHPLTPGEQLYVDHSLS